VGHDGDLTVQDCEAILRCAKELETETLVVHSQ
jgi:hypothetical protein